MNENSTISAKDKIERAISLAGKFNDADKMQYYPLEDLTVAMEIFNDPAVANKAEIKSVLANLQTAIDQRIAKIAKDEEPLSVDDLAVVNRFISFGSDAQLKYQASQSIQKLIDEYDEENGLNQDEEVLRKNDDSLNKHLSEMNLYSDGQVSSQFSELGKIIDRVDVVEQSQNNSVLSEKQKSENISMLFEAAKIEAYRKNVGSIKYLMSTQAEQRKMLSEATQDIFMSKLGQVALSSELTPPTTEELQDEDKLQAYIERSEKEAQTKLQKLVDSKEKIIAKTDNLIAACADIENKASFFVRRLEKRIGAGTSKFSKKVEKFITKARSLWGKKYDIARPLSNNIKDNNIRITADVVVAIGVGVIVAKAAAPVVATAFAANAAYTAVGAYWYPFLGEAKKIQRVAKENGQTIKFAQAWKMARAKLKDSPEHKRNARWGAFGGALGGIVGIGSLGAGLNTVASRGAAMLGRMVGSTSSQIHNYATANKAYKNNPTQENEAKLNGAKLGLGIGLTISAVSSYLSLNNIPANALSEIKDNIQERLSSLSESTISVMEDPFLPQSETPTLDSLLSPSATLTANDVADSTDLIGPEPQEMVPFEPVAQVSDTPKIGDILSQKDYGNGIIETITLGKDGVPQQDVVGLSGSIETSERIQAFYVRRISNMNQYNNLINMIGRGEHFMDANQAVEAMKKQIELGFVKLPDGLTPEHAIHTAFMHGHYTGDMSAIRALACPNGEETVGMFKELSLKYSTDNGFIGRPVDPDIKLPMRAGTIDVKTPCEPVIYENDEIVVEQQPLEKTNITVETIPTIQTIDEIGVTYCAEPDATVEYPAAYAGHDSYPTNNDEGYSLIFEDRKGDGLTAKEVYAPEGVTSYRLKGDNHITLGIECDENITAYQTQRQFNIRDGYIVPEAEGVNGYAQLWGGKVGEAFACEVDGKDVIKYISQEGTVVTFDPDNNYHATVEHMYLGRGVPQDVQESTVQQAIDSINEQRADEIQVNGYQKPQTTSELTRIATKKGDVYARLSTIVGRKGR